MVRTHCLPRSERAIMEIPREIEIVVVKLRCLCRDLISDPALTEEKKLGRTLEFMALDFLLMTNYELETQLPLGLELF